MCGPPPAPVTGVDVAGDQVEGRAEPVGSWRGYRSGSTAPAWAPGGSSSSANALSVMRARISRPWRASSKTCVYVEGDRDACMAEDAAHLSHVEPRSTIRARKGVAEVVEAQWRPAVAVHPCDPCGALEAPPRNVPVAVRGAAPGREDPVVTRCEPRRLPVGREQPRELRDKRDVTHGGRGLRGTRRAGIPR